jgi:hypothetical protein
MLRVGISEFVAGNSFDHKSSLFRDTVRFFQLIYVLMVDGQKCVGIVEIKQDTKQRDMQ